MATIYFEIRYTLKADITWRKKYKNCVFLFFSSAFFWFCNDERGKVKMLNPEYGVGDIAKELGKRWSDAGSETKSKYEAMAEKDKARYEIVRLLFLSRL